MYLAGCSSPLGVQWYLVRPTVPLRPPSPKPLPIGTTCVRKYHWERFLAQRLLFSRRGGPSAGQGKSSRRPTCLFPLGGQRMAAVWTVGVVRGWVGGWVGLGFGELPRHAPLGPPCRASPNDQVVGTGSRPSSGRQLMHLAETTILVVTARVPVWWGQNADLRLRSIFPFLFLKRPSTSHTRGLNLPPMSRRRWESTYV